MIRFESDPFQAMAVCTICGWRGQALTASAARGLAGDHLERCLPFVADPAERRRATDPRWARQFRRR